MDKIVGSKQNFFFIFFGESKKMKLLFFLKLNGKLQKVISLKVFYKLTTNFFSQLFCLHNLRARNKKGLKRD